MHSLTVNWILCMLQRTFNVTQHVKEDNCQSKNTSHDTRLGYKCTEEQQPHRQRGRHGPRLPLLLTPISTQIPQSSKQTI